MSRVYFSSKTDSAELRGSERAYMGCMIDDLFAVSLGLNGFRPDDYYLSALMEMGRAVDKYYLDRDQWESGRRVLTSSIMSEGQVWTVDGQTHRRFATSLNTAYAMGNDVIRLFCRLHGQCELNCYIEGPNRAWIADIIDYGRKTGLMRPDQGWEAVATFLRSNDVEPVVTSYSVTDGFPDMDWGIKAGWTPPLSSREFLLAEHGAEYIAEIESDGGFGDENEDRWEGRSGQWYKLGFEEQWDLSLVGLRKNEEGLEIDPDNWDSYYWDFGLTGFQIAEKATKNAEARRPRVRF